MVGQQAAAADAEFGITLLRRDPVNQLDSRPHAAGILPAAARASQPFAQDGARGHQAAIILAQAARERANLVGGAHAQGNQARQQAGRDRQARAARDIVHLADDFDAMTGAAGQMGQHVAKRLRRPFHTGRNKAGSNDGRLQQAQVVMRKIENFGNRSEFDSALEIDAHQAQHRLVDDTQPRFHRGLGSTRTAHAQVDGDVQHARAFGEVHAQKENVAPAAVAQVHADRCGFPQNRKEAAGVALEQFGANPEGRVFRVRGAKHPLVPAHRAHAAPYLVRERLKAQRTVPGGQGAREGSAGSRGGLGGEEYVERFFEPALQQAGVTGEGN